MLVGIVGRGFSFAEVDGGCGFRCVGDCNGDDRVSIAELLIGVRQGLESLNISDCRAFDIDGSGAVEVSEVVRGVGHALDNCGLN